MVGVEAVRKGRVMTPTNESGAFLTVTWGDPLLAQLAGSDATAVGSDALGTVTRNMRTEPEPLDVGPFGSWRDSILSRFAPREGPTMSNTPAAETLGRLGADLGLPSLGGAPERIAWGALGVLLVAIGAAALVWGRS